MTTEQARLIGPVPAPSTKLGGGICDPWSRLNCLHRSFPRLNRKWMTLIQWRLVEQNLIRSPSGWATHTRSQLVSILTKEGDFIGTMCYQAACCLVTYDTNAQKLYDLGSYCACFRWCVCVCNTYSKPIGQHVYQRRRFYWYNVLPSSMLFGHIWYQCAEAVRSWKLLRMLQVVCVWEGNSGDIVMIISLCGLNEEDLLSFNF